MKELAVILHMTHLSVFKNDIAPGGGGVTIVRFSYFSILHRVRWSLFFDIIFFYYSKLHPKKWSNFEKIE